MSISPSVDVGKLLHGILYPNECGITKGFLMSGSLYCLRSLESLTHTVFLFNFSEVMKHFSWNSKKKKHTKRL